MSIPLAQHLNPEQADAAAYVLERVGQPHQIILTGKAGTGKSTVLRHIAEQTRGRCLVCAPTGIAACQVGGATLHSTFRIAPRLHEYAKVEQDPRTRQFLSRILEKTDLIIIDEISMVRADLIDAIDHVMRSILRKRLPFGGKTMLWVGDFGQIPPVVVEGMREGEVLRSLGYEPDYFVFQSLLAWERQEEVIGLTTNMRQREAEFMKALDMVRQGDPGAADVFDPFVRDDRNDDPHLTRITFLKRTAQRINDRFTDELPGVVTTRLARIEGTFEKEEEDRMPAEKQLGLKVGSRVVLTRNSGNQWHNGDLGHVTAIGEETVTVALDRGPEVEVGPETWENVRYRYDSVQGVVAEVVGSFKQLPLRRAWALNVHKVQGMTLDSAHVMAETMPFSPGMLYVMLSRVRTAAGLSLGAKIPPHWLAISSEPARAWLRHHGLK